MVNPEDFAVALARAVELFRTSPKAVTELKEAMRALVTITRIGGATVMAGSGVVLVDATVVPSTAPSVATLGTQMEAHGVTEARIARGASPQDLLALVRGLAAEPVGPDSDPPIERLIKEAVSVSISLDPKKKVAGRRPRSVTQAFEAAGIIAAADKEAKGPDTGTVEVKERSDVTDQVATLRQQLEEERELVERLRRFKRQMELSNRELQQRVKKAEDRLAERPGFFSRLIAWLRKLLKKVG